MSMILIAVVLPLFVLPLITPTFYGLTREGSRYIIFLFSAWMSGAITLGSVMRNSKKIRLFNTFGTLILLYTCAVFVADLFGLDFATSVLGSAWRHQGYVLLLCCVIWWSSVTFLNISVNNFFKRVEIVIICSHICVLIWALIDGVKKLVSFPVALYNGRLADPIGNPNSLAGYLVMTLPFVLLSKRMPVVAKCVVLIFNLSVIMGTESRSGLLSLTIIVFILAYQYKQKILLICSIPLVALFVMSQSPFTYLTRYSMWDNQLVIWSQGIKAVTQRPILGYGQENYELIFPKERRIKVDNAHNLFLETAVSSGLLGLGIFASMIILAFKDAPFVVKLGLLAFLIRAQFNPLSIVEIVYFWLYLGLSSTKIKSDSH